MADPDTSLTTFPPMKTLVVPVRPLSTQKRSAFRSKLQDAFWIRRPNQELDKSGDALLANLKRIRGETSARAHPLFFEKHLLGIDGHRL